MDWALTDPEAILDYLLDAAGRTGAAEYEVYLVKRGSLALAAKEATIEQIRRHDELSASVRLIDQNRLGFSYTAVFTPEAMNDAVSQAAAGMILSDPQPELALPDPPEESYPLTVGYDHHLTNIPLVEKMDRVLEMEAAALDLDPRVEKVRQAEYRESRYRIWLANSHGLAYDHAGTVFSGNLMVKAVQGDEAEMGYESDFSRRYRELNLKAIGREAAARAISNLGGRKVKTGQAAVILENRVAAVFLGLLSGSFLADNVQKGKSLLAGKVGRQIMSEKMRLVDDGLYVRGLATSPADAEGVPSQTTVLVNGGLLLGFLYDTVHALRAGVTSTGNAGRGSKAPPGVSPSNFILLAGEKSPQDLADELGDGLLVTEIMGAHTANTISGDFSLGFSGIWLANGRPVHPVKGMVLAGNLFRLFDRVAEVGSDLRLFGSTGAPSLLVEDLVLSGL
jgi:PmbA protein